MRKTVAIILIIAGILLIAYPKVKEFYYDHKKAQLLAAWEQSMDILDLRDPDEGGTATPVDIDNDKANSKEDKYLQYIQQNVEGMLKIDRIGLNMPILKGATEENLLVSIASLEGSSGPGEVGNYCIAGHRCRTTGRHFNKLDELGKGDILKVSTGDSNYIYEVFEKLIVKPTDTRVLASRGDEKLITLITCDYSESPTVRLVIRGRITVSDAL